MTFEEAKEKIIELERGAKNNESRSRLRKVIEILNQVDEVANASTNL